MESYGGEIYHVRGSLPIGRTKTHQSPVFARRVAAQVNLRLLDTPDKSLRFGREKKFLCEVAPLQGGEPSVGVRFWSASSLALDGRALVTPNLRV